LEQGEAPLVSPPVNSVPLVSIVIPAYNPRFFQTALHSALNQYYPNFEVVVCDDSRGDEIKSIVDLFEGVATMPIRYVRNTQRLGFVGNVLLCLAHAQGEFVKILCDDDYLFPACISYQAQALIDHSDVNLVLGLRHLWDADGIVLPVRLENSPLSRTSCIFKGEDLLDIFEGFPHNFMGGFSATLFRRRDLEQFMPVLTAPEQCFTAQLDLALYICLLRRGNMVAMNQILSAERLYPERLSNQQVMRDALLEERQWLVNMLKLRTGETAPAKGWVRIVDFSRSGEMPRPWDELALSRALGNIQTTQIWKVGCDAQSFAEFYAQWLACRTFSSLDDRLLQDRQAGWPLQPRIVTVVLDRDEGAASLRQTLDSLLAQQYAPELILVLSSSCERVRMDEGQGVLYVPLQVDWVTQFNQLLPQMDAAQWFYLLRSGDRLTNAALLILAERIATTEHIRCFYSDEGALREGESAEPVFKPDFNLDLLRSYPYVGRALAFQRDEFLTLGGFNREFGELAPHDLIWRLVEAEGQHAIGHIAEIMLESRLPFLQWLQAPEVRALDARVLTAHLNRLNVAFELHSETSIIGNRIEYLHADQPLVSIVIVVKDHLAALQRCVESLLEKTAYTRYEVLLVDNDSQNTDTRSWLSGVVGWGGDRIRVLNAAQDSAVPALHDLAAASARGEYLLMLDAFAVITDDDWLHEMLQHAQRPEVGVVGAKVFNSHGLIVRGPLVLGLRGAAGVPFAGELMNTSGYMQRLQVVQNLSAVSLECLIIRKRIFDSVAALDIQVTTKEYSEVDLCLRVRDAGYLVVWTPNARVALGERQEIRNAQPEAQRLAEEKQFFQRWLPVIARDPAYNPNLILNGLNFGLEPGLRNGWNPFSSRQLPNVLAVPLNASAIGHYRMTQPFTELEAAGRIVGRISYELPPIIELERQSPDVVIVQARYSEGMINEVANLKTYSNARRIYELDDYVISVPKKNGHMRNMPESSQMEALVRQGISLCDRVVVSTEALGDALSSMHHDIRVAPNMLARDIWLKLVGVSQRRTSNRPRIGWGGGTSHTGDLEVIAEVVRELADEVEWVFFGMCPEALRPYLHEFHPSISLAEYPAKLASLNLDLALAPLEFHIFNDCKSNLRLLEYGICGYPVICSDTKAYQGYLPCTRVTSNSTQEWLDAIRMHLADPDASYRMGDELRETVMRDYILRGDNVLTWVHGWLDD
jgi:glycosyltransferase involved in cell wall biosynthesis